MSGGGPPPLHLLVPDRAAERPDFGGLAREMQRLGGARLALHLRLRRAHGRRIHALASLLVEGQRAHGGWCVVNERVDVALATGARAVQLGGGALPPRAARRVLGPKTRIGVSVHSVGEAVTAARAGADFLVAGTIFPSASHPDRPAAGADLLRRCAKAGPPVVAIGGLTPARVPEVLGAGAAGAAVLGCVWDAADPLASLASMLGALEAGGDAPGV